MERGKGGKLNKLILLIGPVQGHISTRRGKGANLIKSAIKKYKYKTWKGSKQARNKQSSWQSPNECLQGTS